MATTPEPANRAFVLFLEDDRPIDMIMTTAETGPREQATLIEFLSESNVKLGVFAFDDDYDVPEGCRWWSTLATYLSIEHGLTILPDEN